MNKATIKSVLLGIIDSKLASYSDTATVSQASLTITTDALASDGLETVNPNGPAYPSTPR